MQKVRCRSTSGMAATIELQLLLKLVVQDLFTSHLLTFHLSLTLLFTIARSCILSIRGWYLF